MIGPWREMLSVKAKCPCGQKGRWQRMTKVYEDSEPEWEHSCDRCMFAGSGGTEGRADGALAVDNDGRPVVPVKRGNHARDHGAGIKPGPLSRKSIGGVNDAASGRVSDPHALGSKHGLETDDAGRAGTPVRGHSPSRNTAKSRKDRKPLPAPIEQKVCSRCDIVFRGYREHCVKCRRWGEPGRPPIPKEPS